MNMERRNQNVEHRMKTVNRKVGTKYAVRGYVRYDL
jgi:hypothetical protein